ncbi:MAG TPA: site-2 protease family protein [Candidatus Acidoferrales bacterium]|nr:site-2 protease family protein [Candidatus Acidoferrales bacterium]
MANEPAQANVTAAPIFPIDFGSLRNMIEYRFTLLDAYVDINGLPTFAVAEEPIKVKFQDLLSDLANHNLAAKIRRVSDKLVISVFPKPHLGQPRRTINVLLFFASVATVGYASYLLIFGVDPRLAAFMYSNLGASSQMIALAVGILSIIGLHEFGHVAAVRHHKMDSTLPYFIPGPPPFGTFGAVISLRAPPANRDQLFDLGFSGPITGFVVMVVVALVAFLVSPLISAQQSSQLFAAKLLQSSSWPNEPYLLDLLAQSGLRAIPAGQTLVWSQVMWAAYIGSLVTFLNLLPVWQLDGGHIMRATLGEKGHKVTAIIAFALLAVAGYWGFAILLLILMFVSRRPLQGLEPLDDISPLSASRKALFVVALVMLGLTFVILPL